MSFKVFEMWMWTVVGFTFFAGNLVALLGHYRGWK